MTNNTRLDRQIAFLLEADKLKSIERRSYLLSESRRENSAEHSWHVALLALILCEHANEKIDLSRVLKMLIVHDLVEIDAGDTFVYDEAGTASKAARERSAAERIFGILPEDQTAELRELWEEFESRETAEAKFANAVDRLIPMLHNLHTGGRSWNEHGIDAARVLQRNQPIGDGAQTLWEYVREMVHTAVNDGVLTRGD